MDTDRSLTGALTILAAGQVLLGTESTRAQAYKMAAAGQIPGLYRVGKRLRVWGPTLRAFIQAGGQGLPGRPAPK